MYGETATTGGRGHAWPQWSVSILLLCTALVLPVWGGCNSEKHYKLLSFFFDGVPDPNARGGLNGSAASESPTFSNHAPFARDNCLQCHSDPTQMRMELDDSSLCLKCHEGVIDEYPKMHGAVVGLACLQCHDPHFSAQAFLLRQEAPGLCVQCHDTGVMGSPIPAHEDLTSDCLECHFGHGGSDSNFLRDHVIEENSASTSARSSNNDAP